MVCCLIIRSERPKCRSGPNKVGRGHQGPPAFCIYHIHTLYCTDFNTVEEITYKQTYRNVPTSALDVRLINVYQPTNIQHLCLLYFWLKQTTDPLSITERKRGRQTYTRYQTLELEKEFHFNRYLTRRSDARGPQKPPNNGHFQKQEENRDSPCTLFDRKTDQNMVPGISSPASVPSPCADRWISTASAALVFW